MLTPQQQCLMQAQREIPGSNDLALERD